MALKQGDQQNFQTLVRAADNKRLYLIEVTEKASGEYRAAICAISGPDKDWQYTFVPLALMITGNPYEMLIPPMEKLDGMLVQQDA